jgi:protease-4
MASPLRIALATLVAPPPLLVDLLRRLRFRGRGLVVIDLGAPAWRRPGGEARLLQALAWLRDDPMVRAVRVDIDGVRGSWADLQAVHAGLRRLIEAGKPVFAQVRSAGNAELYLASAATRVFMLPVGELQAAGLATRMTFLGDALARLGVQVELFTAGAFKSAGEPLTRSSPSAENRQAVRELLEDLQEQLVQAIAQGREIDPTLVREAMAAVPLPAERAVELGLVDELAYEDQIDERIEERLDFEPRAASAQGWWRLLRIRTFWHRLAGVGAPVAVVRLKGAVVDRRPDAGGRELIVADRVVPLLENLRESDAVKGVLITVDSGGGSVLASERIWRAVQRLQEAKPVVALFQGVAASGGYYLAVPARSIYVHPGTITGSIGVIGARVLPGRVLERLGVHGATIRTEPSSDLALGARAMSAPERRRLEASIAHYYDLFLRRVAGGRRRPVRAIEPVAQGRVWSGRVAKEHGLVDRLGTYHDALRRLYEHLGLRPGPWRLPRWDISHASHSPSQRLLQALLADASAAAPHGSVLARLAGALRLPAVLALLLEPDKLGSAQPLALLEWDPDQVE